MPQKTNNAPSKGGQARAAALSQEKLTEIARKGALARWGPKASHRGNFQKELGIDVDCYVLEDGQKTAVISQNGMARAIGLSPRGNAFPRFIASKGMADSIGAELRNKIENPIKFQWGNTGAEQSTTIHGYDSAILIDVCNTIISADAGGRLSKRYEKFVAQAKIITGATAKNGIRQLVYALAGYDATREEIIKAFKLYVQEEARSYEKEFPAQLYEQWYRIYELPRPERNKPWKFKHLTVEQVYKPLAKSNGKIFELAKERKVSGASRHTKIHQFLSEVGVKALRQHLGQLLGIAQVSKDRAQYEKHVREIFGDQKEWDF